MSITRRTAVSLLVSAALPLAGLGAGVATAPAALADEPLPAAAATEPGPALGADAVVGQTRGDQTQVDYSRVIAKLKTEIPQLMAAGSAVGLTISLVDGNRTVWTHGFGWANRETKQPVTTSTLFHIGSASKPITAAAIMQLVQAGRVNLDAPLTRYIPGFKLRKRYANNTVTVRSIMTHHSGIPGDLSSLAEIASKPDTHMYNKTLKALRSQLPTRRVGEAWAYSNLAITLLQGVVQNVTGMSFEQYTARYLFAPMGMASSTFDDARPRGSQLAANYQVLPNDDGSMQVLRRPREYINIRPAGSVVSNAKDMAKYLKTMIALGATPNGSRILRAKTVRQMITVQKASPWDLSFFKQALVWWRGYTQPSMGAVVNHGGDTYMHHTMTAWIPGLKLGVFVSVNTASLTSVTNPVWIRAMDLMIQAKTGTLPGPAPAPAPVAAPNPAQMAAMAGEYAASNGVLDVAVESDALAITAGAQSPFAVKRLCTLRTDGWYTCNSNNSSYRSSVISGQPVLIGRSPEGFSGLVAQRIPTGYSIPAAWAARAGNYLVTGTAPTNYPVSPWPGPQYSTLSTYKGILMLDAEVLLPSNDQLAFTFGPTPMQVMRDAGFSVEATGSNLLVRGTTLVPTTATKSAGPEPVPSQAWEQQVTVFD